MPNARHRGVDAPGLRGPAFAARLRVFNNSNRGNAAVGMAVASPKNIDFHILVVQAISTIYLKNLASLENSSHQNADYRI